MRNVQETKLAWALIEVAKPHMNTGERNYAFSLSARATHSQPSVASSIWLTPCASRYIRILSSYAQHGFKAMHFTTNMKVSELSSKTF